jgi:predicted ATP-dependent endonuclease of OLD family
MKKYTDLSDAYNTYQQQTSQKIIEEIKNFKSGSSDKPTLDEANSLIDQIRAKVESMEIKRKEIMTPMEGVRKMVSTLFQHSGIKFSNRLSFGDAASAVNSDVLSAGEKQMLSFICYNAFYVNSVIFIDEPELSLHVDWQRQLFSVLMKQNSTNQFVIATHSPFIYSKYPDKEIVLDDDRGDAELLQ